ncbi:hypothetical protein ABT298_14325, partial [Streptomyces sp. NPDC001034]|uniref:hypothetical protein n=1 Tax=Streptomyces sp. NPDC001034 TaxID=3154375 RepID=UPI00333351A7
MCARPSRRTRSMIRSISAASAASATSASARAARPWSGSGDRCGHWATIEHAEGFNRLVIDFVLVGSVFGLAFLAAIGVGVY